MSGDPFEGWERLRPPGQGTKRGKRTARLSRNGQLVLNTGLANELGLPPEGCWVAVYLHRMARRLGLLLLTEKKPDTLRLCGMGRGRGYSLGLLATLVAAGWDRDATIPPGQNSIELEPHYDEQTGMVWFQLPPKAFHAPPKTDGIRARLRQRVEPLAEGEH